MEITAHSTKETAQLAQQLAKNLRVGDVIALNGELGAGKTTLVRCIAEAFGSKSRVQSPTFVLARKYACNNKQGIKAIHHLDLYRITSEAEIANLDMEQYLTDPHAITIIEWPEMALSFLPTRTKKIMIEVIADDERKFYVQD